MKHVTFILWTIIFFASCASIHQKTERHETKKEIRSIKLHQTLDAYSLNEKNDLDLKFRCKVFSNLIYEGVNGNVPEVKIRFEFDPRLIKNKADTVMLFILDGEKVRIVSENRADRLTKPEFKVPENLWVPITHSEQIFYRLNIGNDEVNIKPNVSETTRLKEFFSKAIQRNISIHPSVPEGLKKW